MRKRKPLIWHIYPSFLLITLMSVVAVTWHAANSLRKFYLNQTKLDLEARGHLFINHVAPFLSPLNLDSISILKITGVVNRTVIKYSYFNWLFQSCKCHKVSGDRTFNLGIEEYQLQISDCALRILK